MNVVGLTQMCKYFTYPEEISRFVISSHQVLIIGGIAPPPHHAWMGKRLW